MALGGDGCGGFAFVGAVVPFADGGGDLDFGFVFERCGWVAGGGFGPGEPVVAAEVEEFEGALGAVAGGDVAGDSMSTGARKKFMRGLAYRKNS